MAGGRRKGRRSAQGEDKWLLGGGREQGSGVGMKVREREVDGKRRDRERGTWRR